MREQFPSAIEARKSSTPFLDKKLKSLMVKSPYSERANRSTMGTKSVRKLPMKVDDETRSQALAQWDYKKKYEEQVRYFYISQELQVLEQER